MDNNKHGMRWIFISLLVQISLSRIGRTGYLVFLGSDVVNFVVLTTKKYYRMQCNQSMIINHQGKRHVPWVKVSFIGIIVEWCEQERPLLVGSVRLGGIPICSVRLTNMTTQNKAHLQCNGFLKAPCKCKCISGKQSHVMSCHIHCNKGILPQLLVASSWSQWVRSDRRFRPFVLLFLICNFMW